MKNDFSTQFGQRLRAIRKHRGLNQTQLSDKINATQQLIAKYENGNSSIPLCRFIELCQALDTPAAYFVPEIAYGEVLDIEEIELLTELKKIFSVPEFLNFLKRNKSNVKKAHCFEKLCQIKKKAQR